MAEDSFFAIESHPEELEGRRAGNAVAEHEAFAVQVRVEALELRVAGRLMHRQHVSIVGVRRHDWRRMIKPRWGLAIPQ